MKIAFLNSGLGFTKDGVADYTRTLALQLTRQGHECRLLGLNDADVATSTASDCGDATQRVPTLRLSRESPWSERSPRATEFLDAFQPAWVSLQFVAYGYDPKGIVRGWAPRLEPLTRGRDVQVMLHELWLGSGGGGTLKHRLIGRIQRLFVARLLNGISPQALHTSNPTYAKILKRSGFSARCLPLFGSIPLQPTNADEWLFRELRQSGIQISPANRGEFWLFGFFGSLHPEWPVEPLLSRIRDAAAKAGRRVIFAAVGRMGPGETLWDQLARDRGSEFIFARLGVRSELEVSQFFNSINFAIATSPLGLIGKSSTVAAMLEHDLPVIVNREQPWRDGVDAEPLEGFARFILLDESFASELARPRVRKPRARVAEVCQQLLDDFQHSATSRGATTESSQPHLSRA